MSCKISDAIRHTAGSRCDEAHGNYDYLLTVSFSYSRQIYTPVAVLLELVVT